MKHFLVWAVLLFFSFQVSHAQYTLSTLPNPKTNGQDFYVSNPDRVISTWAADSVNRIAIEINQKTKAEVAIVLVNDFQGEDDFEFALNLFNSWGIGNKERNNGLLLFVAKNRRAYRFISGYGLESQLPDITLKKIGEHYLVPNFKAEDYNKGLIATINVLKQVLCSPSGLAELNRTLKEPSFWSRHHVLFINTLTVCALFFLAFKWSRYVLYERILQKKRNKQKSKIDYYPLLSGCFIAFFLFFIIIFALLISVGDLSMLFRLNYIPWYIATIASLSLSTHYYEALKEIKLAYKDEKNRTEALSSYAAYMAVFLFLAPLALLAIFRLFNRRKKLKLRLTPPDSSHSWVRLDRDKLKKRSPYLNEGQAMEEHLQAKSYEVWQEEKTGTIKAIAWIGDQAKVYAICPSCGYQTLEPPYIKTLKAATYKASGEGEKIERCANCNYQNILGIVTLAKKVYASSSSGSDSSSNGGASSSSGSWGGGSSGGGGAGGHW